jgi:hypothetical protein
MPVLLTCTACIRNLASLIPGFHTTPMQIRVGIRGTTTIGWSWVHWTLVGLSDRHNCVITKENLIVIICLLFDVFIHGCVAHSPIRWKETSEKKGLLACSHQNWEDRLLLEVCFYKFENISDSFALLLILVQWSGGTHEGPVFHLHKLLDYGYTSLCRKGDGAGLGAAVLWNWAVHLNSDADWKPK